MTHPLISIVHPPILYDQSLNSVNEQRTHPIWDGKFLMWLELSCAKIPVNKRHKPKEYLCLQNSRFAGRAFNPTKGLNRSKRHILMYCLGSESCRMEVFRYHYQLQSWP